MKLRGKQLDNWNRSYMNLGDGLSARFEVAKKEDDKYFRMLVERIEALDALTDAQFNTLSDSDIASWIDANQGWNNFDQILAGALPLKAPIPKVTSQHLKGFLWVHGPDQWPILTAFNPWAILAIGSREQIIMSYEGDWPLDQMSARPQLFWMPHGSKSQPCLQIGFWPADGSPAQQLVPCSASVHPRMSHSVQPHYIPPKVGWLRMRVIQWAASQNKQLRNELGEWSDPVLMDKVFVSTAARKAWSPTMISDIDPRQRRRSRSGHEYVHAELSNLVPTIPIESVGNPNWTPSNRERPLPLSSTWTPPPLPVTAEPVEVSDDAKAWLASRVKRYGRSKSTGKFWTELAEKLGI